MVRPPKKRDETNYDADYKAVMDLRTLASEHGIAIVLVHHLRKADADDAFDTVSGTLGLTGAVDTVLVIKRDTWRTFTMHGRGRDLVEIEKTIDFNAHACTWAIVGNAREVRASGERKAIIAAMTEINAPASPTEIATAAGMKTANVRQLLIKLAKDGAVKKCAYGKYALVSTGEAQASSADQAAE